MRQRLQSTGAVQPLVTTGGEQTVYRNDFRKGGVGRNRIEDIHVLRSSTTIVLHFQGVGNGVVVKVRHRGLAQLQYRIGGHRHHIVVGVVTVRGTITVSVIGSGIAVCTDILNGACTTTDRFHQQGGLDGIAGTGTRRHRYGNDQLSLLAGIQIDRVHRSLTSIRYAIAVGIQVHGVGGRASGSIQPGQAVNAEGIIGVTGVGQRMGEVDSFTGRTGLAAVILQGGRIHFGHGYRGFIGLCRIAVAIGVLVGHCRPVVNVGPGRRQSQCLPGGKHQPQPHR